MKTSLKPFVVVFSILFIVTLVIPTLVVIPFSEKTDGELAEAREQQTNPSETQIASESSIEVAVHRSSINAVENVPLEEYIVGVLASEMPADFELEALKAQALAARTYIVRHMLSGKNIGTPEGATVTDTVNHQVYKNKEELKKQWGKDYDKNIKKFTEAVYATQGQIITYDGAPIDALYFSTSNGYTENSEDYWQSAYPYLKSVESTWDLNSKKFHNQVVFKVKEFERRLGISIGSGDTVGTVKERTESNRIKTVEIGGKEFSGKDVRTALDLKSTDFKFVRKGDEIVITTKGYGHGVGMSQYGANGMAQSGSDYKKILTYYYQGIDISSSDTFLTQITASRE
ncbi:stage II sporulation protein D [Litchfieldia salsa]|uniref:Stage II sporulation protein D n=1 Tax=Litchfieldia salsa TaxID=930152 RepID=A0A1H0U374_9BACI|nr:stage II sporulation protein D [Litchfieldia salsa]SDP60500.1 stage II sporulation protein D [Litchfieldia salsa]